MPDRQVQCDGVVWLEPDWGAPAGVHAISTTRLGGVSEAPWDSLNLGDHVGDQIEHVSRNRGLLIEAAQLPDEPFWLKQVHGCGVADPVTSVAGCEADVAYTNQSGKVCAVMTADCLPVLFCNGDGSEVAAAHAGWRGLCDGALEAAVEAFNAPADQLHAWLGPAISQQAFEVGDEVREAFLLRDSRAEVAFVQNSQQRWMADLYLLARLRLERVGVAMISGGEHCTFSDAETFFSYRRDGITGRMASLVWIAT